MSSSPRICDVIGVGINREFFAQDGMGGYSRLIIDGDGEVRYHDSGAIVGGAFLCRIINNPDGIFNITNPTEEEIELCRRIGANYASRDEDGSPHCESVYLWGVEPRYHDGHYYAGDGRVLIAKLPSHMMPSLLYGQCLFVGRRDEE